MTPAASTRRETSAAPARIPRATYRLQLHRDFTFADATALVPYLAALGVSHVYCSPWLRARPGSRHGYDIVDHAAINPEIGSRADFDRFVEELATNGMGQIADIVPNHMGVMGADNAWWLDVLEHGPASRFAAFFDIDWHPLDPELADKVLVPVLGDHYGRVLERGELRLAYEAEAGAFVLRYFEHRFPVDPREYPRLLEPALEAAGPASTAGREELKDLSAAFARLPSRTSRAAADLERRHRDSARLKASLAQLVREHAPLAPALGRAVQAIQGMPGDSGSFAALHELLEAQAYRVVYWRVASDAINYRRFFDVNDLAALRMESDEVFESAHRFILGLAAAGKIDGLRIDHPDGLYDPAEYFQRLQQHYARLAGDGRSARERPLYVVVEKIEAAHEQLPASWRVQGTTGYRFAGLVTGLFVDPGASARLDRTWRAFVRDAAAEFDQVAYNSKCLVMRSALLAELNVLAHRLLRIARADRNTRDLTLSALRRALTEITACFPVYRTYVAQRPSAQDRRYIDWAVRRAQRRSRSADPNVFSFVHDVLLLRTPEDASSELLQDYRTFAMRYQQFTAPVMAKGVEDTAFYVYNRLASLNEVGGAPERFGTSVKAFHLANAQRNARWPYGLLALSTHDNKRSADVRMRIDVISEIPAVWRALVRHWRRMNRRHKRIVEDKPAPSANDEYLLYQTLIGTFPAGDADALAMRCYRERVERYMIKAAREAKVFTSWVNVNAEYESVLSAFVAGALEESPTNAFLANLRANIEPFAWFGALNSLSMALLHCTAPGVPDIYQGSELNELSLVDPDNRRAVDYGRRRELLGELETIAHGGAGERGKALQAMLASSGDGRLKLWVIARALELRRTHPDLFAAGDYTAVPVAGEHSRHVVAFERRYGGSGAIAVAGRLYASLGLAAGALPVGAAVWSDTRIELPFPAPAVAVIDVLTGETVDLASGGLALARAFAKLPCALLTW